MAKLKLAVLYGLLVLVPIVTIEGLTRAYFAWQAGSHVLLYGTPWFRNKITVPESIRKRSVQWHQNEREGYTKYFPHEQRALKVPGVRGLHPLRINNHGFRGPDFTTEKPAGVRRVLTLGASSTFGYTNRDDETYPHYLEAALNERTGGTPRYEVINFAIPHATASNIFAMFVAEGLALDPDVVTFYEGVNDSGESQLHSGARSAIRRRLLAAELAYQLLQAVLPSSQAWSEEAAVRRRRDFIGQLDRLREVCDRHGIGLIVVTQQAKSLLIPPEEIRGVTYAEEARRARASLAASGSARAPSALPVGGAQPPVSRQERKRKVESLMGGIFLTHAELMRGLRAWAAEHDVLLVDGIALLDDRRDLLASWVHLRPEANRILADALAREILRPAQERHAAP